MHRALAAEEFDPASLPAGPVPVLFTADWCGPCRRFKPAFERRAAATERLFLSVDVSDEESPLWDTLGLRVVPTVIVFKSGEAVHKEGGFLGERDLDRILAAVGEA